MTAQLTRWFGPPALDLPAMLWARPASHMQHGVARGGMFYMTEDTLGFQPRGIDALLGARAVSWSRASLTDIELKPTLRKLRVTLVTADRRDRLIVSDALVVFHALQSWRPGRAGGARS
jgi:hypothetical protein